MRFFKYIALLALASVPLMFVDKKKREPVVPESASNDDIFEHDLQVD